MAMTKLEIRKTVLIILVLNIILPTADVVTDLRLIGKLYRGAYLCTYYNWSSEYQDYEQCEEDGSDSYCSDPATNKNVCEPVSHPNMTTAMLIPFCLNYIFCFITFFRQGTDKKKTFIFPLLNLYPQFEAARLILAIIRDPETGIQMKSLYEQNVGLFETFLESVPTTLILTYMCVTSVGGPDGSTHTLRAIIIGGSQYNFILFLLTFILSLFSACLGLAKCLKDGVARPIAPGGPVDGLLSGRFILAFLASACCLVVRGFFIVTFFSNNFLILPLFLPQLLLAIFSTLDLSSRNSLKILISHPSLILLPVFTFFTFSKIQCCGDRRVKFSVRFTLINMAVSVGGIIASMIVWWYTTTYRGTDHLVIVGSLTLLAIFFALSFLYMDKLCCCCCSCFLSAPGQLSVFDPDHPEKICIIDNEAVEEVIEVEANAVDERNIPTITFNGIADFVETIFYIVD